MRFAFLLFACLTGLLEAADLRLGIIGTDTSHVPAFTQALNDPQSADHVPGARIVMAYRGGSPDIEESARRIDKFTGEIVNRYHVKLVSTIAEMCPAVDGLLLESVDGRAHLSQFREAARCGKPVFVDKPLAAGRPDAEEIARIGRDAKIPWFSASTLRYSPVEDLSKTSIAAAFVWAPGPNEPHQPLALTWYGIHGVEMLYTILGPGCHAVSQLTSADSDTLTGIWNDGRQGTIHLQRPYGKIRRHCLPPGQKRRGKTGCRGQLRSARQTNCHLHADQNTARAQCRDPRNVCFHGCRPAQQSV